MGGAYLLIFGRATSIWTSIHARLRSGYLSVINVDAGLTR
jgi:hypothetical protein